jgi:uncharacterized protein (TIGR03086 family)
MDFTSDLFLTNAAAFDAVVAQTSDWSSASPCAGWTGADVLAHVIDTQRSFLTDRGLDPGPAAPGTGVDAWGAQLRALRDLLADGAAGETAYDGWFGPTTVGDSLARFYGFDLIVHRWDIATAAGSDTAWSEDEMDQLEAAIESFGPTLYADGICGPAVEVPDDAPRQVRLLGRLGRAAR